MHETKFWGKANILLYLKNRLNRSIIDDLLVFSAIDWQSKYEEILDEIISFFPQEQILIVRSATSEEDNPQYSMAGCYNSELGIENDPVYLVPTINRVIASYRKHSRDLNPCDKVIIQAQVQNTKISGVIFTRDPKNNSPYYIINYDSRNGRTDTITQGSSSGNTLRVFRDQKVENLLSPWNNLLLVIQEIESIFQQQSLDIEFAIDCKDTIHIFQVRPLQIRVSQGPFDDSSEISNTILNSLVEFEDCKSNGQKLRGAQTIFTDMSDWNPAEILGGRPNPLDVSLYRFLVTQSIWNQARVSMGYTDVAPAELMVVIADKPYIDARVSFNSLTPSGLPHSFHEKLMSYYLHRLEVNPALQDKVEFEILFTCFDPVFDARASLLLENGFSKKEIAYFKQHLLVFTNALLQRAEQIFDEDVSAIRELGNLKISVYNSAPKSVLNQAYQLLTACQKLGTFPFSRLARLAFIGLTLLKGLLKQGEIDALLYDDFLNSIETVAKQMTEDFYRLAQGMLPLASLMDKYGHLRPGTYNILAPRYRDTPNLFDGLTNSRIEVSKTDFLLDQAIIQRIDCALASYGLQYDTPTLFSFVKRAIEYREYSKFEFTKSLSDAIELIALAGEQLGFTREEMVLLDLDTIMAARESNLERVKATWQTIITENKERKNRFLQVALPPIITSPEDFWMPPCYESYPNFITRKRTEGVTCVVGQIWNESIPDILNKIVLIESADPGYDWIFTRQPKGLITKYGGVASHMAIRCAELGLPAAIGCGEAIFDRLSVSSKILLDCAIEIVIPLS